MNAKTSHRLEEAVRNIHNQQKKYKSLREAIQMKISKRYDRFFIDADNPKTSKHEKVHSPISGQERPSKSQQDVTREFSCTTARVEMVYSHFESILALSNEVGNFHCL